MEWKHLKEANLQGPLDMCGMIILMAKHTFLCLGIIWAMFFLSSSYYQFLIQGIYWLAVAFFFFFAITFKKVKLLYTP